MPLAIGTRIGPYDVLARLGAGGMGEVYRARDSRLGRDVALKILPDGFTRDADRVVRFTREAQLLAALNHPNIGALYGLEETASTGGTTRALVLELVDGQTLADYARGRRLSVSDALRLAGEIAAALEAAHDKGIVHRDLKPGNVMITPNGSVKVLDFGLAKVAAYDSASGTIDDAPTETAVHSTAGLVLGTAAYMSPEQAQGRTVDRRTDLWAFGALLYELLAGRRAFGGASTSETLAHLLTQEPDWQALPTSTPLAIRRLLRRCLQKERQQRLDSATAARLEITDAITSRDIGLETSDRPRATPWALTASVVLAVLASGVAAWKWTRPEPVPTPSRFGIVLPASQRQPIPENHREIAISPDGRLVAMRIGAINAGGLALRRLDTLDAAVLPGITNARSPFFSYDGQWIGFFDGTSLKKVSVNGGPPIVIASDIAGGDSASWAADNRIIYSGRGALWSVSSNGGTPTQLLAPNPSEGDYSLPSLLPDGGAVLFTISQLSPFVAGPARRSVADADNVQVAVLDLKTGSHKVVLRGGTCAEYARSGHLLYAMAGTLFAIRFDTTKREVVGDPAPVVQDLQMALNAGAASYAISHTGTLLYVPGSARTRSLVWVDRRGTETAIDAPPRAYHYLKLSPDGSRVVLEVREEQDLYVWHFSDATLTRLTFDSAMDVIPAWTPDGRHVVFGSARDGKINLYMQPADGTGVVRRLTTSDTAQFVNSVARDGRTILGGHWAPESGYDIVRFSLDGKTPPDVLVQTPALDYAAMVSPDGRYFAYQSYESGRSEIYVRPLPNADAGRWQVSNGGASAPVWAPNGKELFYLDHTRSLMAAPVDTSATFRLGTPRKILDSGYAVPGDFGIFDVSPDGQRFLMLKETGAANPDATPTSAVVIINWFTELTTMLPAQ